ncbi:hypothetical protein [Streptomyces inhibens]|uniref:hypothetical protein n=1 Tax=Streptomyces inhibens TaxID=2293571 RepID=UPI001EE77FBC|nr:hypothetical protein [Streptomyces inhibens]UKY54928.1 hypothetical protein KI385_43355 [Streptomyces inhibens]
MTVGADARELYEALVWHEGAETYEAVVVPWLDRAQGGYRAWLAAAAEYRSWWTEKETALDGQNLLWNLYALSRVSDLLLLAFQPPANEVDSPEPWLRLPEHEYLGLFTALGMTPFEVSTFDPFLHEIVEVEQADDPHAPIEITEVVWPGLMMGQLLFSRAGVRVRAGVEHAQRGVADRSPLYWTFRRRHRPTVDLSQGWGHNSQWRTDFRLDYRTPTADRLNVVEDREIDGSTDISPDHPANLSPEERLLTPDERRELLRHRCLLRVPEAADALAGSPGWERDMMPFGWRLPDSEQ